MDPTIVREVQHFCRRIDRHLDRGESLGILGGPGRGKTSLAMTVPIEAMRRNRSVGVYTAPDLMTAIRKTYDDSSYTQLMESLLAVDLLHIEDLAVPRTNDWVLEQLYTIVNDRYQDQRSIIFTADIESLGELGERIGHRTASRLIDICGEPILMHGEDYRLRPS